MEVRARTIATCLARAKQIMYSVVLKHRKKSRNNAQIKENPLNDFSQIVKSLWECGSGSADHYTVASEIPEFWTDARLWFAQFEAVVANQKLGDEAKYNLVVAKLHKSHITQTHLAELSWLWVGPGERWLLPASPFAYIGGIAGAVSSVEIFQVRSKAAYDGEGKTTVRVLNQEHELGLMIDSYATYGFRLNNGLTVLGPMAIFPRTVLAWLVGSSADINEHSLRLFKMLTPKIDILILGLETQERKEYDRVFKAAKVTSINVEILPTEHACSTFNFLNAESRSVAAALIPPMSVQLNEDDMLRSKLHYNNLYEKTLV